MDERDLQFALTAITTSLIMQADAIRELQEEAERISHYVTNVLRCECSRVAAPGCVSDQPGGVY